MKTTNQPGKATKTLPDTPDTRVVKRALIALLAAVFAFSGVGCSATGSSVSYTPTTPPDIKVPTSEVRFVSLAGTELPEQILPPDPQPPSNPLLDAMTNYENNPEALEEPVPVVPIVEEEVVVTVPGDVTVVEVVVPSTEYPEPVMECEAIEACEVPLAAPESAVPSSNPVTGILNAITSATDSSAPAEPGVDYSFEEATLNTEEYALPNEQGFFNTATNPLSTFSADVDTASYSNLRRMINEGAVVGQIPSGSVRIEEMLNYFNYDFIMPDAGKPFALNAQIADCPWNPESRLMILGVQAQLPSTLNENGSNLVFLIDVSGSMGDPNKLDLLKKAFVYLVDQLSENDTISIVTYASGVNTVLSGASGSEKERIIDALNNLKPGGSTNGSDGLMRAYALAERHFIAGGNNRIIMASDGDLNVGITSTNDLYEFVSYKRQTGVYLSVLGFGAGNYKDEKMETLADNGNGNYHYIDTMDEAEKVFGIDLMSNLVCVANDVKLQIEFNPEVIESYRLIGYENRQLNDEDFLDDTKDAAEMGAGHQAIVAYEIIMTDAFNELDESELEDLFMFDSLMGGEETDEDLMDETSSELDDSGLKVLAVANTDSDENSEDSFEYDGTEEDGAVEEGTVEEGIEEGFVEGLEATDEENASEEDVEATDELESWCTVALRYKVPGEPVSKGVQFTIDASVYTDNPDKDWMFISGVIEAGLILSNSSFIGTAYLEEALARVEAAEKASATSDQYRKEFADLLSKLMRNSS